MQRLTVMVNGLPGNMATRVANAVSCAEDMELVPVSLTGPEISDSQVEISGMTVELIKPAERADFEDAIRVIGPSMAVDFTLGPDAEENARFYGKLRLPFVMGTTGGNAAMLQEIVHKANIQAVIAPNMAIPIVLMQQMLKQVVADFPGALKGFNVAITESHQSTKKDTSGTALAMSEYLQRLTVSDAIEITSIRDADASRAMGVPEDHLGGHGWHRYQLDSPEGSVHLEFVHNVNGRQAYVDGAIQAIRWLAKHIESYPYLGGRVYSMINVL